MKLPPRYISLTAKMVLVTFLVGGMLWGGIETFLTRRAKSTVLQQMTKQMELQTTDGKLRFDKYIKSHFLLAEIISGQEIFRKHYQEIYAAGKMAQEDPVVEYLDFKPPWIPSRAILANIAQATYYILLNSKGEALEIYQTSATPVPRELLKPSPQLISASQNENFITTLNNIPFVISSRFICPDELTSSCLLLLATPIDDQLLVSIQPPYESEQIIALSAGINQYILASSDKKLVPSGVMLANLGKDYLSEIQTIYSYEVTDLLISYLHLMPRQEMRRRIDVEVRSQRVLNATIFIVLFFTFLLIMLRITNRVESLSSKVIDFTKDALGKEELPPTKGDQLAVLESRYHALTDAVVEKTQKIEAANVKLADAYTRLKQSQSRILQQEKMASIGQLAAGVAHEINNPMGFIQSNLTTLKKYFERLVRFSQQQEQALVDHSSPEVVASLQKEKARAKVDYILEDAPNLIDESLDGTMRVRTIVSNLKSFSRVDQDKYKDADINECIETTLNIIYNELKYKATVIREYGQLPLTYCSPQSLNQVFMNIIVNSGQAIEEQGEIRIKSYHENDTIFVIISDTGKGMPQEIIPRIFEPFFTTKDVGQGTGLGLSICYDIIKEHGGDICVQSEIGKGTEFTIALPVRSERDKQQSA